MLVKTGRNVYTILVRNLADWRILMDGQNDNEQGKQPALEINPAETYQERPVWQRIGAFVLIALVVAATVACAFWKLG